MTETYKNRNLLPIGTRVKPSFDRISKREGTVLEHSEDGQKMLIQWDDQDWKGYFMPVEVKKA